MTCALCKRPIDRPRQVPRRHMHPYCCQKVAAAGILDQFPRKYPPRPRPPERVAVKECRVCAEALPGSAFYPQRRVCKRCHIRRQRREAM
jgi:hypothetical protein